MLTPQRVKTAEVLAGRYALYDEIATGGMASVHFARILGAAGFHRIVAVKRLHKQFARDPDFVSGFIDEARLAARIRHPNVVQTLDVVLEEGELFLVMEYVPGESLAGLFRASAISGSSVPVPVALAIMIGALEGLHAAHEARSETGDPLSIVHRDVSPQNILVGTDGIARVLDFGIAKASARLHVTREGQLKGKLAYMPPEQLRDQRVSRQSDVYSAGVVLWELLTGRRLFSGQSEAAILTKILDGVVVPPSLFAAELSPELDAAVLRALASDPEQRYASAQEMASALRQAGTPAAPIDVGAWLVQTSGASLTERAACVRAIELDGSEPTLTPNVLTKTQPALDASEPSRPHPVRRRLFSALALALGGGVLFSVAYAANSRTSNESPGPAAPAIPAAQAPVELSPLTSASAPTEPPARAEASAKSVPAPARRSPARVPRPVPKASAASSAPASTAVAADCRELMYRDASGILRLKKQCL